jgi:hypothetical protein
MWSIAVRTKRLGFALDIQGGVESPIFVASHLGNFIRAFIPFSR